MVDPDAPRWIPHGIIGWYQGERPPLWLIEVIVDMPDKLEPSMVDRVTLDMINGPQMRLRLEDLEQVLARVQAENEQLRGRNKALEARLDQILILANLE